MYKKLNTLLIIIIGGLIVFDLSNSFASVNIRYAILAMILIFIILNIVAYWRNRVKIKIIKQNLTEFPYSINFIAENIGNAINSLGSKVLLDCLIMPLSKTKITKLCGEKCKHIFYKNNDVTFLEYHSPKKITATTKTKMPQLYYSNFRRYKFYLKNGINTCLYFIDTTNKNVSFVEFYFKRFLYRFFKVEEKM